MTLRYLALTTSLLLAGTLGGCQHEEAAPALASPACPDAGPFVKAVVDAQGTVAYDRTRGQYLLLTPRAPGLSTGTVDGGFVCDSLPASLRTAGQRVRFSGSYWQMQGATSGDVYSYYLSLSKVTPE